MSIALKPSVGCELQWTLQLAHQSFMLCSEEQLKIHLAMLLGPYQHGKYAQLVAG